MTGLLVRLGIADEANRKATVVPSGLTGERVVRGEVKLARILEHGNRDDGRLDRGHAHGGYDGGQHQEAARCRNFGMPPR